MKIKRLFALVAVLALCLSVLTVSVSAATISGSISSGQHYIHTSYVLSTNGNVSMSGIVASSSSVGGRFQLIHYMTLTTPTGVGNTYYIYPGGSFNTGMVPLGKTNYGGSIYPITGTHGTVANVTVKTP